MCDFVVIRDVYLVILLSNTLFHWLFLSVLAHAIFFLKISFKYVFQFSSSVRCLTSSIFLSISQLQEFYLEHQTYASLALLPFCVTRFFLAFFVVFYCELMTTFTTTLTLLLLILSVVTVVTIAFVFHFAMTSPMT